MTELEDQIVSAARLAALKKIEQLTLEHNRLVEKERAEIAEAASVKASLPANHWHERHRVWELLQSAKRALDALS